jgi:hypothetical protein
MCTLCRVGGMQLGPRSDGRTVHRASAHINSEAHVAKVQAARGQRSLTQLGFFPDTEPQQPELCWGFHESSIPYGEHHNDDFFTERHAQHEYRRDRSTPVLRVPRIRSRSCTRFALESSGSGPRVLSCAPCLSLPKVNSFRMLLTRKRYLVGDPGAEPLLPDKRTNFRFPSPDERVSTLQQVGAQYRDVCFRMLQLKRRHIALTARARTLVERARG